MNRKLISDISASTVQVILNQALGLVIFFLTSRYLSKEVYGEMNWSLAVLAFATTILSLRLEQVVVRKVAAGVDASKILTLFTAHILFAGIGLYLALLVCSFLFASFFRTHDLLLILALSHLLSFFASPYRQIANGKENFRLLAIMSSAANLIRAVGLLFIVIFSALSINRVLTIYIASSAVELLLCVLLAKYRLDTRYDFKQRSKDYFDLIRESLPLAGAVILNASIARIDWILLGVFTTAAQTAEYSFAYKVFELSPFPLLIIAPILLSRFSKFFSNHTEKDLVRKKEELSLLIRMEMIFATLVPLVLNLIWVPFIDSITDNKYGSANSFTFFILSCCIPFQYINNILWSVCFAQNRLKRIFRVTFISFIIILAGDLALIPMYAAKGAAVVYLVATLVEYLNYMARSPLSAIRETWLSPLTCILSAILSGVIAIYITDSPLIRMAIALPLFCLLLPATKQLRNSDKEYMLRHWRTKK